MIIGDVNMLVYCSLKTSIYSGDLNKCDMESFQLSVGLGMVGNCFCWNNSKFSGQFSTFWNKKLVP